MRQEILQRCGWKFFRIPESRFYGDPAYMDQLWPELEKFVSTKNVEVLTLASNDSNPHSWEDSLAIEISAENNEEDDGSITIENANHPDFDPDSISYTSAGELGPREVYIDGLRVREFPKPVAREFSWLQSYQSWDREDVASMSKISSGSW